MLAGGSAVRGFNISILGVCKSSTLHSKFLTTKMDKIMNEKNSEGL